MNHPPKKTPQTQNLKNSILYPQTGFFFLIKMFLPVLVCKKPGHGVQFTQSEKAGSNFKTENSRRVHQFW